MPSAPICSQLAPAALFIILSLGKLFLREKILAVKSGRQEIRKTCSGKHADCRFDQFARPEWMGQTEDKFGSVQKGGEEGGQMVGDHFFTGKYLLCISIE